MHQTLLALLGMLTLTLMSFNQTRSILQSRQDMLDDEMEVMASGIALQAMEYIGTKSFDQSTVDEGISASEPEMFSASMLSRLANDLVSTIPSEQRCALLSAQEGLVGYDTCDDLSDYNEMEAESVPFVVGQDTVLFRVTAEVHYVDETQQRLAYGTSKHKEVVVIVSQAGTDDRMPLLRNPIRITRTFSIP